MIKADYFYGRVCIYRPHNDVETFYTREDLYERCKFENNREFGYPILTLNDRLKFDKQEYYIKHFVLMIYDHKEAQEYVLGKSGEFNLQIEIYLGDIQQIDK